MTTESPEPEAVPAMNAVRAKGRHPLRESKIGMIGIGFLILMFAMCLGTLPWTLSTGAGVDVPRYDLGDPRAGRLPPSWWPYDEQDIQRSIDAVDAGRLGQIAETADR